MRGLKKPGCPGEDGREEGQDGPAQMVVCGSRTSGLLSLACRGAGPPPEAFVPSGEEEEDSEEDEEEMLSDASPWTYSSSPDEQVGMEGGAGWSTRGTRCRLEGWACCWRGQVSLGKAE